MRTEYIVSSPETMSRIIRYNNNIKYSLRTAKHRHDKITVITIAV